MADEQVDILALSQDLGKSVLESLKSDLGAEWDALPKEEKDAAKRLAEAYMALKLREKLGENVDEQLGFVEVGIKNFRVSGEIAFSESFAKGVNTAASLLGSFLLGRLSEFIPLGS